jgi:uncharacterized membrane protein
MARTLFRFGLCLVVLAITISAVAQVPAQTVTSQGPQAPTSQGARIQNPYGSGPKPPDMVCFGYYPNWTVQFLNGEARYLGINEPDQYFLGDFYWVEPDKVWEWHRANGVAPTNGSYALSASIQKADCKDPVRKATYPYSSQVYLPQGDMVSGCCRKLLSGEAPVGRHGAPTTAAAPQAPAPAPRTQAPATQPGIPRAVSPPKE